MTDNEKKNTIEEKLLLLVALILEKFKHGNTIQHLWFEENLWIKRPEFERTSNLEHSLRMYDRDMENYHFQYMNCIDKVKPALRKHKMYLTSIRGIGYKLLTPNEHAAHATTRLIERTDKAFQKAQQCMESCNTAKLTASELNKHELHEKNIRGLRKVFNKEATKRQLFKVKKDESKRNTEHPKGDSRGTIQPTV